MKTLNRIALAITAALALAIALPVVAAQLQHTTRSTSPQGYSAASLTFDPAAVTSAVAFDSGVIDTQYFSSLSCQLQNDNDGGGSRAFIPKCVSGLSGTKVLYTYPTVTVETNNDEQLVIDPAASSVTASSETTVMPHQLCRYIKLTAAAAAGNGQVQCTLRTR